MDKQSVDNYVDSLIKEIQSLQEQLEAEKLKTKKAIEQNYCLQCGEILDGYIPPQLSSKPKSCPVCKRLWNPAPEDFIETQFGDTHLCEHRKVESVCDICKKDGEE